MDILKNMGLEPKEKLIYKIYKLINDTDDAVYIGSTRSTLAQRIGSHRNDARIGNKKKISRHMRKIGIGLFHIHLIKEVEVATRKEARIMEQEYIDQIPKDLCLNVLRAYSYNREKTRDQDKKRASRRAYYHRKKQDPIWMDKQRAYHREKMRIRRAKQKLNIDRNDFDSISETERE